MIAGNPKSGRKMVALAIVLMLLIVVSTMVIATRKKNPPPSVPLHPSSFIPTAR
jgi:hypothetical protein